uniref:Uncharacterized protein n=1 Tax=Panagrolaimus superbus TaxID=310955 RepID=A0A914YGJ8_9BILA
MVIPIEIELGNFKAGDDLLDGFEFPRYNLNYNLKPYKFIYGSILLGLPESLCGLIKVNADTGEIVTWKRDHKKQIATEPVFIPHPEAKDEDDGD